MFSSLAEKRTLHATLSNHFALLTPFLLSLLLPLNTVSPEAAKPHTHEPSVQRSVLSGHLPIGSGTAFHETEGTPCLCSWPLFYLDLCISPRTPTPPSSTVAFSPKSLNITVLLSQQSQTRSLVLCSASPAFPVRIPLHLAS